MTYWMRNLAVLSLILIGVDETHAADLEIKINGLESTRGGAVYLAVYSSAKGFESYDTQQAFATFSRQLTTVHSKNSDLKQNSHESKMAFSLADVPPGQYAIHYYHDANNNQQFDSEGNQPLEGWGVSKARHMWQSPDFKKASYKVAADSVVITLKTFYAN